MLGRIASAIGEAGGDMGGIDIVQVRKDSMQRDFTVAVRDEAHAHDIAQALRKIPGVHVRSVSDPVLLMHLGGKIEIQNKVSITTRQDLSTVYTPGVARVCRAIADDPESVWNLTIKGNTVAIVTDGTAVLGLGRYRPGGCAAGDGGQGDAVQGVRAGRRLADLPGHDGRRRDRAHGEGAGAGLRRDQPGGHLAPALLRNRAALA